MPHDPVFSIKFTIAEQVKSVYVKVLGIFNFIHPVIVNALFKLTVIV